MKAKVNTGHSGLESTTPIHGTSGVEDDDRVPILHAVRQHCHFELDDS